jgi:hypothetical protein
MIVPFLASSAGAKDSGAGLGPPETVRPAAGDIGNKAATQLPF